MVQPASRLALEVNAAGPNWPMLRFVCGDAVDADMRNAWLVVVNNNGWSDSVTSAIIQSAASQLPSGAALVLHRWPVDSVVSSDVFVKVGSASLETSWRDDAQVLIYIRQ